MSLVMSVSDQVVALDFGRKIAEGTPAEVQRDPEVIRPISAGTRLMAALLEVAASRRYGETQALHGVGFSLEAGGITTLLGANGAGKTTTLRAICGMVRTEGEIRFDGQPHRRRADRGHRAAGRRARARGRGTFTTSRSRRTCASAPMRAATRRRRAPTSSACLYFPDPRRAARASRPARCRAASSRCWRSAARLMLGRA